MLKDHSHPPLFRVRAKLTDMTDGVYSNATEAESGSQMEQADPSLSSARLGQEGLKRTSILISFVGLFIITLTCLIVSLGCSRINEPEVTPGEFVDVKRSFGFTLPAGDNKYLDIPLGITPQGTPDEQGLRQLDRLRQLVLRDLSWKVPSGVKLEQPKVEFYPSPVEWDLGGSKASAPGAWLELSCKVKFAADAPEGQIDIEVSAPGMAEVGTALKTKPELTAVRDSNSDSGDLVDISPSSVFTPPSTYLVRRFHLHSSVMGKYTSETAKWGVAVIIVMLIIYIGSSARKMAARG